MKTPSELIEKIDLMKKGDSEAFNSVYEESYKYLHTCVIHIVKNEDVAQDMLQDTYVEIFKNIDQLKSSEDFLSWASTIANRKCFAYIKKDRDILVDDKTDDEGNEKDFFEDISDDESFIPENIFDNREKINIIRSIIDDLSDVQRACVIGFYYNDQKQDEIAQELGIPVNTVKSHLNRAKAKIKDAVSDVEKKQGIKLYSFAPFMLLLFGFEAKAYAAQAPVPAMGSALSGSLSGTSKAVSAGSKAAGSALKIKVMIAAIAGIAVIGAVTGIVLNNRTRPGDVQIDVSIKDDTDITKDISTEDTVKETEDDKTLVSKEEPVTEPENDKPALTKLGNTTEAGYDYTGYAYGGVIIVKKNDLYGAVDYDFNEIVPCRYERFSAANLKGYFVMFDGSNYYLFDKTGKEIYKTPHTIIATANCFIIQPTSGTDEWCSADRLAYYDYDGNLIIETSMGEDTPVIHVGSHDDNIVLLRRFTDDPNNNHCLMEVGKLYEDGHITWQTEYEGPVSWTVTVEDDPDSMWEGNAASWGGYMPRPLLTGLNGGYYVTYHPYIEWGYMTLYDENSNEVADFDIKYMHPDGSYNENRIYSEENDVKGYYYDGAYNYNRGTLMVIMCGDKNVLTDVSDMSVLAVYDYISLAEDDLYLVSDGDKWGYIDPSGKEIAMYDDAGAFYNGYAPIIKDGKAYIIDTDLNEIEELGEADSVFSAGELYAITKDDSTSVYQMKK